MHLNRARVYAPFPVVGGSSISHYDTVASRNLLMEPAINADLTHNLKAPDDLTFELLRDVGWTFPDPDGDGFVDDEDCNVRSDRRPTIVIGSIDTGVPNRLFTTGCTSSDLIAGSRPRAPITALRLGCRAPDQRVAEGGHHHREAEGRDPERRSKDKVGAEAGRPVPTTGLPMPQTCMTA